MPYTVSVGCLQPIFVLTSRAVRCGTAVFPGLFVPARTTVVSTRPCHLPARKGYATTPEVEHVQPLLLIHAACLSGSMFHQDQRLTDKNSNHLPLEKYYFWHDARAHKVAMLICSAGYVTISFSLEVMADSAR